MAGLKALQHALELDPKAWIAWYHIGETHIQLGSFELANESFDRVTSMTAGQIGVMSKMAEAFLFLGRQTAAGGFRERSKRAFGCVIELACEVLRSKTGHRPWCWKVIGDAAFELANTPDPDDQIIESIRRALAVLVEGDTDKRSMVDGLPTPASFLQETTTPTPLHLAVFAFAFRAWWLKNEPRVITSALYDLSASLHALSRHLAGEKKRAALKAAIGHIRNALDRDAGDERLWNALGVLCEEGGEEVAQHAFVVSLELYSKDPIVWTNLGYLYFRLSDLDLAGQCFLKSQTLDPDYARAWLGQGLIADSTGDQEHARALSAHAVTLSAGSLIEADLAAASSAFQPFLLAQTPPPISELNGPAFALKHYIHQRPSDASAHHLYGLICERLGLTDQAADAFSKATGISEHEFEDSESVDIENRYILALVNHARVSMAGGAYEKALSSSTSALDLVSSQSQQSNESRESGETGETWISSQRDRLKVQCLVVQGLAYFWIDRIDEAFDSFENALEAARQVDGIDPKGDTRMKENTAVLLARTLWSMGTDEARETAKSHLMEW